ncbi:hypothetical protein M0R45_003380 [Rubus argutus]|uniref:Uncharacterized protein n=1 Tax=Rubus argutus TaxID=59490 RepID=A0AAW1YHJ4_RUBAR
MPLFSDYNQVADLICTPINSLNNLKGHYRVQFIIFKINSEPNYSLQLTKFKPSRALSSYPNHKSLPSFNSIQTNFPNPPPVHLEDHGLKLISSLPSQSHHRRASTITDTAAQSPHLLFLLLPYPLTAYLSRLYILALPTTHPNGLNATTATILTAVAENRDEAHEADDDNNDDDDGPFFDLEFAVPDEDDAQESAKIRR